MSSRLFVWPEYTLSQNLTQQQKHNHSLNVSRQIVWVYGEIVESSSASISVVYFTLQRAYINWNLEMRQVRGNRKWGWANLQMLKDTPDGRDHEIVQIRRWSFQFLSIWLEPPVLIAHRQQWDRIYIGTSSVNLSLAIMRPSLYWNLQC